MKKLTRGTKFGNYSPLWSKLNQNLYTLSVGPQKGKNTKNIITRGEIGKNTLLTFVKFSFSLAKYAF